MRAWNMPSACCRIWRGPRMRARDSAPSTRNASRSGRGADMSAKTVRIGGASGFWGDSSENAAQLVHRGEIDFLVFDYLAEITMSLLARIRARKPELGYVPDFIEQVVPLLPEIRKRGIRVVSNGGGVNPVAAAAALKARAEAAGITLVIAVVTGDDLMSRLEDIRARGISEMFSA